MGDRFHRAAKDGSSPQGKALLKEATSRDLNRLIFNSMLKKYNC